MDYKNNDGFAEFKAHLIHRKQVPLLHNTVFILCDEGDGLVSVHKPFSKIFNNQRNLLLSKSILARNLNSPGSEFANISEN